MVTRNPRLPPPGEILAQGYLSHLAAVLGEEATLPLLAAGLLRLARRKGLANLILGLGEGHSWLPFLRGMRALRYPSRFYLVHWPEGRKAAEQIAAQPIQTEVACL